ncbi:hypothetical protein DFH08DRAFT_876586 [Mycena albidolilacea]|uniref:3-carboxymuconate cyclase n=1 Tax=Mycena albidolilacea TaxID=1033008 RepID=A0AAD6ZSL5_9AGAR|nr:hypothetical protein DFH08DRAFT_876586 [Mycena albidolilacea]
MHCINIALALSAAMLVSAAPANVKQNPICNTQDKNRPGLTAQGPGGIYWMSNEPTGNFVFTANLDANGKMLFGDAVYAGGNGAHMGPDTSKPNALQSQGSVKVVNDKLVVVNAGSDTASIFQIDFQNPAFIRMIGQPISTMGNFPVSATIDTKSGNVCILNAGQTNGVSCYSVDLRKGLVPIQNSVRSLNLKLTTPPANPDNTPSQILFSDDGKRLFASVKGSKGNTGFVAVWTVNDDGSLSPDFVKNTPNGGANPASLTIVRGADALMNTDIGKGINILDFGNGSRQAKTQDLQIGGSSHTAWGEFSDATKNYYISDSDTAIYTELSIDPKNLQVKGVKQYPQKKGSFPIDQEVALIDGKDTAYLLSPGAMTIQILSLVAPGNAQQQDDFDLAKAARGIGATLNGNNMQGINAFFTG